MSGQKNDRAFPNFRFRKGEENQPTRAEHHYDTLLDNKNQYSVNLQKSPKNEKVSFRTLIKLPLEV